MSQNDFIARSRQLGHHVEALRSGESVITTRQIHSLEELRQYLANHQVYVSGEPMVKMALGAAPQSESQLMQHVMDYAIGNTDQLAHGVAESIQSAFPLSVSEESAPDKTFGKGENLLAESRGGIVSFNYGTVTIEDGGWLTVRNTNVIFKCDRLILKGAPTGDWCDINILGVDAKNAGESGTAGSTGGRPQNKSGWCEGLYAHPGHNGENGATGIAGSTGNHALPGLPSLTADFQIIKAIESSRAFITVQSRSGAGGNGGKGQKGGTGGKGGKGGDGATCGCGGSRGGNGGNGGRGGQGGNGGNGSDGVDAQGNITIMVPEEWVEKVKSIEVPANFGQRGDQGAGGDGGPGGDGGGGGKNNPGGDKAESLGVGPNGDFGKPGTKQGTPGKISVRSV